MAKMFYTLEEVCEKLGKSEEEIRNMASSGQLQEFRDRDKLMFKVDQIDLLTGSDDDTGDVSLNLEDTSGGSGLDLKADSSLELSDSREGSGISVFDTQVDGPAIEAGDTQAGEAIDDDLTLEAVGSGSGLLDLTRESDDTSLGAELLEEVYSSDENIEIPANASGLFEAAGADSGGNQLGGSMAGVPMVMETYDGAGSGLGVGLMLGALVSLVVSGIIVVVASMGATPDLAIRFSDQLMIWGGGLLGATILFGLIGMFIGKASG